MSNKGFGDFAEAMGTMTGIMQMHEELEEAAMDAAKNLDEYNHSQREPGPPATIGYAGLQGMRYMVHSLVGRGVEMAVEQQWDAEEGPLENEAFAELLGEVQMGVEAIAEYAYHLGKGNIEEPPDGMQQLLRKYGLLD